MAHVPPLEVMVNVRRVPTRHLLCELRRRLTIAGAEADLRGLPAIRGAIRKADRGVADVATIEAHLPDGWDGTEGGT